MAIQTSAGTTLGIVSGTPATYDEAGFARSHIHYSGRDY
jgi:hypothetical protein